jgi:hypothetical protein
MEEERVKKVGTRKNKKSWNLRRTIKVAEAQTRKGVDKEVADKKSCCALA